MEDDEDLFIKEIKTRDDEWLWKRARNRGI